MVLNTQHGAAVQLVLFGRDRYLVPLGAAVAVQAVWWIDPVVRHDRLPFNEFVPRLIIRHQGLAA
jgi:hypothetical protein